jgi:hypothetical protein
VIKKFIFGLFVLIGVIAVVGLYYSISIGMLDHLADSYNPTLLG